MDINSNEWPMCVKCEQKKVRPRETRECRSKSNGSRGVIYLDEPMTKGKWPNLCRSCKGKAANAEKFGIAFKDATVSNVTINKVWMQALSRIEFANEHLKSKALGNQKVSPAVEGMVRDALTELNALVKNLL